MFAGWFREVGTFGRPVLSLMGTGGEIPAVPPVPPVLAFFRDPKRPSVPPLQELQGDAVSSSRGGSRPGSGSSPVNPRVLVPIIKSLVTQTTECLHHSILL